MRQPHAAFLGTTFQYQAGYTSTHTSTRTSTHTHAHTCTHTHTHTQAHTQVRAQAHTLMSCTHMHTQAHACTHTRLQHRSFDDSTAAPPSILHVRTCKGVWAAHAKAFEQHMQRRLKRRCCIIARSSPGANTSCNRSSSAQKQSHHMASNEPPSVRAALHSCTQTERLDSVGVWLMAGRLVSIISSLKPGR